MFFIQARGCVQNIIFSGNNSYKEGHIQDIYVYYTMFAIQYIMSKECTISYKTVQFTNQKKKNGIVTIVTYDLVLVFLEYKNLNNKIVSQEETGAKIISTFF